MNWRLNQLSAFLVGVIATLTLISSPRWFGIGMHRNRPRLVIFGDSITQLAHDVSLDGFAASLSHHWTRRLDVLNRGYSGYNSKWGFELLHNIMQHDQPDILLIFFGANDAIDENVKPTHVPLEMYGVYLEKMVVFAKSFANVNVLILSPPPVWEEALQEFNKAKKKEILIDRENSRTEKYAIMCNVVGSKHHVPVIDLWEAMEGATIYRQNYLLDGLHLNAMGNHRVHELIVKTIEQHFPKWSTQQLPYHESVAEYNNVLHDNRHQHSGQPG